MWNDSENNCVVVSRELQRRHPAVYSVIEKACLDNQISFQPIESKNIWTRDFMPVQTKSGLVKFVYGYATDNPEHKNLKVNPGAWTWLSKVKKTGIRLDGGNIIYYNGRAIITDIIHRHNQGVENLVPKLESILGAQITVIPKEPGDDIGHADGVCKFTPDGKLLVHDYRMAALDGYRCYFDRLMNKLSNFDVVLCPLAYAKCPDLSESQFRSFYPEADTFNPGYGYYLNMLVVANVVIVPQFNIEEDAEVLKLVKKHFPKSKIYPVFCSHLSMEGGLVNCVTATYKL